MKETAEDSMEQAPPQSGNGAVASAIACPIATVGEVFAGEAMIELVRNHQSSALELWLWDGEKETRGSRVSYKGRYYEPARIDRTLLHHLTLPTRCSAYRSTGELLTEVCRAIAHFAGLDEKSTEIAGRMVLGSALVDAMDVAPALVIVGPDVDRANRLMTLLHNLCRHALSLAGVTPAGIRSLPGGLEFTFLITQTAISPTLENLLDDASKRDQRIPSRGGLLDLFGMQVIHSDSFRAADRRPLRSIQIPMIPSAEALPPFDKEAQERTASDFQAKLLDFRRAKLGAAGGLQFDATRLDFALRDLARSLAAATPDDIDLQTKVFELLRQEDAEIRSIRWIDPSVIALEAVLVACNESLGEMTYVSELSKLAAAVLHGRGEDGAIDPGVFGKRLKVLGFVTEPRDAKGIKLHLTEAVRSRAKQLARDLGVPGVEHGSGNVTGGAVFDVGM